MPSHCRERAFLLIISNPTTMRKHVLLLTAVLSFAIFQPNAMAQNSADNENIPLRLWFDKPATYFEESLPIGNGKIGASIYGGTDDNILFLNDITLWTGKPTDPNLDAGASRWIPRIREALFAEDYALADSLQLRVQGPNSQYYQPLGTLHILDDNGGVTSSYRRELNLRQAICTDSYERGGHHYSREYFASHPDKMIAIRISSDGPNINCRVMLTAQVPHGVKASPKTAAQQGSGKSSIGQLTMTGHAVGDEQESTHYCCMLKAEAEDGEITASDSVLTVRSATQLTLYIINSTSFRDAAHHPVKEGASYLSDATDQIWHLANLSYEQMRQNHIKDYQQFFSRMELHLGGDKQQLTDYMEKTTDRLLLDYTDHGGNNRYLETLYFQFGRYLLISCSRTPHAPANLQGLWTEHLYSPWRGNYTVNINLEENYWPAEVTNLSEMTTPLWDFMKSLADNGRHVARNYYGISRGWCSSHNSDIWAMANPVGEKRESPEWSNWNLGGAWLTMTLWEHYRYTLDKQFLTDTAYPLMRGATEFCLDWLIDNPRQPGELITAPSTSPENEYRTTEGYHGTTCYGGTADLAIIRELFANTLAAGRIVGEDKAFMKRVENSLSRLHPYTIGHDGDLNEWYYDWDDWDPQHRHQSHLIGLYPGHHITKGGTPDLAQAARRTLEIKGDKTTGWSTGWRINLWARLHDGEEAYRIYRKLLTYVSPDGYKGPDRRRSGGTYPNLFDAHPPFQIDGNFGGTAGVCEMLLQGDEKEIELLPALPTAWGEGRVEGLRARGGYTVDITWNKGELVSASITASQKGKVNIAYKGKRKKLKLKKGATCVVNF